MQKFSLLLIDDHPIVCLGIETLLKDADDFHWLGAATSAADALEQTERLKPDLIVLDLMLAGRDGLELMAALREASPRSRIVIYSALSERVYARRAFDEGASGYVPKDVGFPLLLTAIRSVAKGEPYASAEVKHAMFLQTVTKKTPGTHPGLEGLSNQELLVFRMLGSGLGSSEVAARLGISVKTVSTYRERIKNKLGLQDARDLERAAERFFRSGTLGGTAPAITHIPSEGL